MDRKRKSSAQNSPIPIMNPSSSSTSADDDESHPPAVNESHPAAVNESPPAAVNENNGVGENETVSLTLSLSSQPTATTTSIRPRLLSTPQNWHHRPPPPQIHQYFPLPITLPMDLPHFNQMFYPPNFTPAGPSFINLNNPPLVPPPPPSPTSVGFLRPRRPRRNQARPSPEGRSPTITPPFPWSTNLRATVHSLNHLLSNQIAAVSGEVQCRRCERRYTISFNLMQKYNEVAAYITNNRDAMHHRAPKAWLSPPLPTCEFCGQENAARPVIADKKRSINWLFLLLGQMLGCCTLEQLKYFCKHTKNHRTGAKDRVLYLAYLALCKQLDPNGPFDV
ncbi:hypothetical protein ABFS83_14G112100 [Erythranthe nasuta]